MTSRVPEISDEELVRRADQARQVTQNEMYREAWSSVVNGLQAQWEATKPMATEEREAIWHAMKAVKASRQLLENLMQTGRQAALRIDQGKKRQDAGTRSRA